MKDQAGPIPILALPDDLTIEDSQVEMVRQPIGRGSLAVFRKPRTPDPFINPKLTSVGPDENDVERFWMSCVNSLCGTTSFLIDEEGAYRAYSWTVGEGIRSIYAVAQADPDTLWLAGGAGTVFVKLTLSTGEYTTYPRGGGRFVTSGMVLDRETGKLFCGAQTALESFDTRNCRSAQIYDGEELPPDNFQHDWWRNADGSYGTIVITPGLTYLRWNPKSESIDWQRLTDDPHHPSIALVRQFGYTQDGLAYLPHLGWLDGTSGRITPHEHPPAEEACWFGRDDGRVYGIQHDPLNNAGRFLEWDTATGETRTIFTASDTPALNCALSRKGKIVIVDVYGLFRRYDAATGSLERTRTIETEREHLCNTIIPADGKRIVGTPFISQNFWVFNTRRKRGVYGGRAAGRGGQVDYAIRANGKVYFAAYTGGQLTEFDPEKPAGYPRNPRLVAQVEQGNHGTGITTDGDVVRASFRPSYGTLDGAMVRFDTRSGGASTRVVESQHILSPMYDRPGGRLVAGTSFVSDCDTAAPVYDRAFAVILDPDTMEIQQRVPAPPDVTGLEACGPIGDGRWLMRGGTGLLAFDIAHGALDPHEGPAGLPGDPGALSYAGEPGRFLLQTDDTFLLWDVDDDALRTVARFEAGFIRRWWIHGPDLCFDCGRHAAIWRRWRASESSK